MVFNLIFPKIKMIISDAAVPYSVPMIGFIPFPHNRKTERKPVDELKDLHKRSPTAFHAFLNCRDDPVIRVSRIL